MKTFWLSFCGNEGHRGVCVIDVTEAEAAVEKIDLDRRFPRHAPGAEWFGAAMRKAWQYDCNPGGDVGATEIPLEHPAPRNRLLVGDELAAWGAKPTRH